MNSVAVPVLSVGGGSVGVGGGGGGSSTSGFWAALSTFPNFQLAGITGVGIVHFILLAFIIYVSIILYTDGDILVDGLLGSLRASRSKYSHIYCFLLLLLQSLSPSIDHFSAQETRTRAPL